MVQRRQQQRPTKTKTKAKLTKVAKPKRPLREKATRHLREKLRHMATEPPPSPLDTLSDVARARLAQNALDLQDETRCQHPKSLSWGVCKNPSAGEFDIPPDYTYEVRHAQTPELPRPRARLCRQHRGMVEAFAAGKKISGHAHEVHCDACRHPDVNLVNELWMEYKISSAEAQQMLGIKMSTWYAHVHSLGLDERKMTTRYRKRMLLQVVEKGLRTKTHTVANSIRAMKELADEVGDRPRDQVEHKHTIVGLIGTVDVTKLSIEELADFSKQLHEEAIKLSQQEAIGAGMGSATIDLPKSAVQVEEDL